MPVVNLVRRLIGIVSTTASQERIFSTYGNICTKKRNRLRSKVAMQLVFLNRRFNDRPKKVDTVTTTTATTVEEIEREEIEREEDEDVEDLLVVHDESFLILSEEDDDESDVDEFDDLEF